MGQKSLLTFSTFTHLSRHENVSWNPISYVKEIKCNFMKALNPLCRVIFSKWNANLWRFKTYCVELRGLLNSSMYVVFLSSVTIEIRIVAWPIMRVSAVFFFSFLWRLLVNLVPVVVFPAWDIKKGRGICYICSLRKKCIFEIYDI